MLQLVTVNGRHVARPAHHPGRPADCGAALPAILGLACCSMALWSPSPVMAAWWLSAGRFWANPLPPKR